jgi:site-specific recombinase XerD
MPESDRGKWIPFCKKIIAQGEKYMQVREAVEEFLFAKSVLSRATQRGYRIRLTAFVAWCEEQELSLEQLTARHIRAFVDAISARKGQRGEPLKSSTVRLYALTTKIFLAWCAQEEDFKETVSQKMLARVQLPKEEQVVIETFSPEQVEAMLRATEKQPFAVRDKAIVSVLLDSGVRAGELCGLTLDCVWLDTDDSYLRVTGKGRKQREVPLGRTARIALRRYITRYRQQPKNKVDQHVFLSRTGAPITISGLEQIIEQIGERAHIKNVRCSPHTLRHTFACTYLLNGGDLYRLSRLLGHSSLTISLRYLQAIKDKQARQGQSVLDHLKETL